MSVYYPTISNDTVRLGWSVWYSPWLLFWSDRRPLLPSFFARPLCKLGQGYHCPYLLKLTYVTPYHTKHQSESIPFSKPGLPQKLRSADLFKKWVSGQIGEDMVSEFVGKLRHFADFQLATTSMCKDFFILVLIQMGEAWRRFTHKHDSFPYVWWQLCDLETHELCSRILDLQARAGKCSECVDVEFSGALLDMLPSPFDVHDPDHQSRAVQVQRFLHDCSKYIPISTDQVEALHGYSQGKVYRFRGCRPTDQVGKEITFWSKVTSSFALIKRWVWDRKFDAHGLKRLAAYGLSSKSKKRLHPQLTWQRLRQMAKNPESEFKLKPKKLCGDLPSFIRLHLLYC